MMLSCNVVRDLLPSYLEHLTGEKTDAEIAEHLETCAECRAVRDAMAAEVSAERAPKPKTDFLKRLKRRQIAGAVLAAVVTALCVLGLYNMEFSVRADSTATLEAAIDDYFFNDNVDADIIESRAIGNRLFVFFDRQGYVGHCGTALLERGVLGRYRFLSAGLTNQQLYSYTRESFGGKNYLILYGINDLPNVASYAVYPSDDVSAEPIYRGETEKAPFLRIIETKDKESYIGGQFVHYYGADGAELTWREASEGVCEPSEGRCSGVGSAELFLVYAYIIIVLLLGFVFVRYFLKP